MSSRSLRGISGIVAISSTESSDAATTDLRTARSCDWFPAVSPVQEIEAALERLPPEQLREVSDWIAARLMPATTPAMLSALDEGIRSLQTEPTVPTENVRHFVGAALRRDS